MTIDDSLVHLGSRGTLKIDAADALGQSRPGAHVTVEASSGKVGAAIEAAPGKLRVDWQPIGEVGKESLNVRAWGPPGTEPGRLVAWAEGGSLNAAVTDLAGLPVPVQGLKVGATTITTDAEGVARIGPLTDGEVELGHAEWPGLSTTIHVRESGRWVFPSQAPR